MQIQICYLKLWIRKQIRQPVFAILELLGGPALFLLFVLLSLSTVTLTPLSQGHQFSKQLHPRSQQYVELLCSVRGVAIVPSSGPLVKHFEERLKSMGCLTYLFQNSSQLQEFVLKQKAEKELMGAIQFLQAQGQNINYRLRLDPTTHILNQPHESVTARTFAKQNLIDNTILSFYGVDQQLQHIIKTKPTARPKLYSNLFDKMGQFIDIIPVLSLFLTFCRTAAILRAAYLENLIQLCTSKSGRLHWHLSVWVWRSMTMGVQCGLSIGVYKVLQSRVEVAALTVICLIGILNIAIEAIAVGHLVVQLSMAPLFSFLSFLVLYLPMNLQRNRTTLLRPFLLALGPSGMGLTLSKYLFGVSTDGEQTFPLADVMWQVRWLSLKVAVAFCLCYQRRSRPLSEEIQIQSLRVNFKDGRSLHIRDRQFKCGQIVSVQGPNGSGKSTFMQVFANRVQSQQAQVKLFGLRVENAQHQISYLQQKSHSISYLSVQQNLQLMAGLSGCAQKAAEYLRLMRLQGIKGAEASCLSAGEARRLELAMRVTGNQRIWLLDQPLNKVDQQSSQILKEFIRQESKNRVIFISSHNQLLLQELASSRILLQPTSPAETKADRKLPGSQPLSGAVFAQLKALLQVQFKQESQRLILDYGIPISIVLFCLLIKSLKIHQNYQPDPLPPSDHHSALFQFNLIHNSIQILVSDPQVSSIRNAVLAADKLYFKEKLGIELNMQSYPLPINYKGTVTNSLIGSLVSFLLCMALNYQATSALYSHGKSLPFMRVLFRSGLHPAVYFSARLISSVSKVLAVSSIVSLLDVSSLLRVQGQEFLEMSVLVIINLLLAALLINGFTQDKAVLFFGFNFIFGAVLPLLLLVLLLFRQKPHFLLFAAKFLILVPNFAFGMGMILSSASLYLKTFNELNVEPSQLLLECKLGMLASSLILMAVLALRKHTHDRYQLTSHQSQPETSRQIISHSQDLLQFKELKVFYSNCFKKGFQSSIVNARIIQGQTVWLVGPNGVGKSSVLKVLANQPLRFQGQITCCVTPEQIGLSKQTNELPLDLTIRKVIRIVCLARKIFLSSQQIESALGFFKLEPYGQTPLGQLSGGYLKKANLLIAMLGTRVWLLDEPLQELDEQSREFVLEELRGQSVVMVSHCGRVRGVRVEMK